MNFNFQSSFPENLPWHRCLRACSSPGRWRCHAGWSSIFNGNAERSWIFCTVCFSKSLFRASHHQAARTLILLICLTMTGCSRGLDQRVLDLSDQLQVERIELGRQRDQLEADRRRWDQRERREALLAECIRSAALLIVCVSPLIVVAMLLRRPIDNAGEQLAVDLLVRQSNEQQTTALLPPPSVSTGHQSVAKPPS